MPKAIMPPRVAWTVDGEGMLPGQVLAMDGVEAPLTGPLMKNPLRSLILYKKKMLMIFKKYVIVRGESMDR
jgi:hypothetical protein